MSRIITRITRGRINTGTKKVLVLAVAGMLYFTSGGTVAPPIHPSGGGGGYGHTTTSYRDHEKEERDKIIKREREDELFLIEFLKTATNIINNQ